MCFGAGHCLLARLLSSALSPVLLDHLLPWSSFIMLAWPWKRLAFLVSVSVVVRRSPLLASDLSLTFLSSKLGRFSPQPFLWPIPS